MNKKGFTYKEIIINELLEMNNLNYVKDKLSYLQTFNFHEV